MAVPYVPDTTCARCGEEIEEDGLMVSKFQVMKADGSCHNYCRKCFPRVYRKKWARVGAKQVKRQCHRQWRRTELASVRDWENTPTVRCRLDSWELI